MVGLINPNIQDSWGPKIFKTRCESLTFGSYRIKAKLMSINSTIVHVIINSRDSMYERSVELTTQNEEK